MFGWRNLIYALIAASLILVTAFSILIYYYSSFLVSNIVLISKGAAVLLGAIGAFWLGSSIINRVWTSEADELRNKRGGKITFFVTLQLVSVEELEIFLILIPLILTSHTLEATSAATIGIVASVSLAAYLRKDFERFVVGRMRYLKMISGSFLIVLGVILFFEA
jgi:uncharacterized membrane protein